MYPFVFANCAFSYHEPSMLYTLANFARSFWRLTSCDWRFTECVFIGLRLGNLSLPSLTSPPLSPPQLSAHVLTPLPDQVKLPLVPGRLSYSLLSKHFFIFFPNFPELPI